MFIHIYYINSINFEDSNDTNNYALDFSNFSDIKTSHITSDRNSFYTIDANLVQLNFHRTNHVPESTKIVITSNLNTIKKCHVRKDIPLENFPDIIEMPPDYRCKIYDENGNFQLTAPVNEWCSDLQTAQIQIDKDAYYATIQSEPIIQANVATPPKKRTIYDISK